VGQLLDIHLPMRVIFEKPTIQSLSEHIVQEVTTEVAAEAP
jgi:hypothetical protein